MAVEDDRRSHNARAGHNAGPQTACNSKADDAASAFVNSSFEQRFEPYLVAAAGNRCYSCRARRNPGFRGKARRCNHEAPWPHLGYIPTRTDLVFAALRLR
jgi:hypothetical protein